MGQVCDLAPSFKSELRKILVKPRTSSGVRAKAKAKPKVIDPEFVNVMPEKPDIEMVNLLSEQELYHNGTSSSIETVISDENGYCPRLKIVLNDMYLVNTLLDGGAVPNIISIELVKQLDIKELEPTQCNYITANGKRSKALGITQNIVLRIFNKELRVTAIVYNYTAFPFLLGRRTLKKLKILTDWETCSWIMKTNYGIQKLPVNFDTHFGVQLITNVPEQIAEDELEVYQEGNHVQYLNDENEEEEEEEDNEETEDEELFVLITNELMEPSDQNFEILEGQKEITVDDRPEDEKITEALKKVIEVINPKFINYKEGLKSLLWKYIDIFGISHQNVRQTDIIQFDIDTGDAKPVYIKPRPLPYKFKEFVKQELEAAVQAGTMIGPLKQLCRWGFPVWVVAKLKTNEL